MDITELLTLFDHEQRIGISYPGMRKDIFPHLVRNVRDAPGKSWVQWSALDERSANRAIDEQITFFRAHGGPFEWKVYGHDQPADLPRRLEARGFVPEVGPDDWDTVMALDLRETPPALLAPVTADVRRITSRDGLQEVIAVEEKVWDEDFSWMYERMGPALEIPGYLSIYIVCVDNPPACTGWIFFEPGSPFASLWGGSTAPAYRGRGLYTALLATRVQEARQRGYRFLVIDAGAMSRPIVEKYGFRRLTTACSFEWKPPQSAPAGDA